MKTPNRRRAQAGFTLIELMVAAAVAAIAGAAITSGFIGLNRLFYTQEGIRAGQASLRQSIAQVTHQLRNAGYGIEAKYAIDYQPPVVPSSNPSWNKSERLIFRMRDPTFGRRVALNGVTPTSITLAQPLGTVLKQGQIIQIVCPDAVRWTYATLAAQVDATAVTLPLSAPGSAFPNLNADLASTCYNGNGSGGAFVFKVETYDYNIELIDDGIKTDPKSSTAAAPLKPFLVRRHGLGGANVIEPVADNIEVMHVVYLRKSTTTGLKTFTPDISQTAPTYDTPVLDNDHPANAVAVRIGFVARSGVQDQATRAAGLDNVIPSFGLQANGTPYPEITNAPAGYHRVLYETTIPLRNLRSIGMFIPPFTRDAVGGASSSCAGTAPSDGFNCFAG